MYEDREIVISKKVVWALGAALALAILWAIGAAHTPYANGHPYLLTRSNLDIMSYLDKADRWGAAIQQDESRLEAVLDTLESAGAEPEANLRLLDRVQDIHRHVQNTADTIARTSPPPSLHTLGEDLLGVAVQDVKIAQGIADYMATPDTPTAVAALRKALQQNHAHLEEIREHVRRQRSALRSRVKAGQTKGEPGNGAGKGTLYFPYTGVEVR